MSHLKVGRSSAGDPGAMRAALRTAVMTLPSAHCGRCRLEIVEALRLPGVAQAEVDLRTREATVLFDPGWTSRATIVTALAAAGHRPALQHRPSTPLEATAMRDVILMMSVSLDGFIEGPERELDWHMVDDELHRHFNEQLSGMGAFVSGRITYELMAGFWPTADTDPSSTPPMVEFAGIWRDMPKIVFSKTLDHADWNTTVVRDFAVEEITALKAQPGGDLALGGADLAAAFMRHDLIDEYRLYVHPILIGGGKPLFPASDLKINLRLAETRTFGNGVVLLRYRRPQPQDTERVVAPAR